MKRRQLLTLLVGAATARPIRSFAQQSVKRPVLGFLVAGSQASHGAWVTTFAQRLSELGWADGRNVRIEYKWAAGDVQKTEEFAGDFVRQKVDVIVTSAYGVVAAKQATSTIPIVFAAYGDAVANGFAASLSRPGGNVTGLSVQPGELSSKRLELLREAIPSVRRLAALVNINYAGLKQELAGMRVASARMNIELNVIEIATANDIEPAMAKLSGHTDALYVYSEPLTNANKSQIIAATASAKIPTIFAFREFVDAGGLLSYGPNFSDLSVGLQSIRTRSCAEQRQQTCLFSNP